MNADPFDRIGLVVHPRRELGKALASVREWAERQGAEVVQVRAPGAQQQVAPPGEVRACDLVIALGGETQMNPSGSSPSASKQCSSSPAT